MIRKLTLAGFAVVGLLGIPLNAQADQITLGNNNLGGITVTGTGTLANVTIAAGTGCIASFGCATFQSALPAELGGYSLGPLSFSAGPEGAGGLYPSIGANTETFSYTGQDGDSLTGTIHWNTIQDNSPNPKLFGSLTILTVSGDAAFTSAFVVSGPQSPIDMTLQSLGMTLDALVSGSHTATVGISSGQAVSNVPLPAALPLFAGGLVGLGLLGWRRKKKAAPLNA